MRTSRDIGSWAMAKTGPDSGLGHVSCKKAKIFTRHWEGIDKLFESHFVHMDSREMNPSRLLLPAARGLCGRTRSGTIHSRR